MTHDSLQRARRRRVGLLVLAAGALFVGMIAYIVGSSLNSDRVRYFALFVENVKGMVIGSNVNFQGVPIGAVTDIRFQDGRTLVEMSVDPERAVIQTGTRARLDRLLVTGQVTVELEGYHPSGKQLRPGGFVEPVLSPMNQLTASMPETLAKVDTLLDRAVTALERVDQLATAFTPLAPQLQQLLRDLGERSMARLDETGPVIAAAHQAVTQLGDGGARLLALAEELEALLGASRRPWLEGLAGMREAFGELRLLARNLRQAPSTLLYGRDSSERPIPEPPRGGR